MMKKLLGKQHNLPEHLKAKIEASPAKHSGAEMYSAKNNPGIDRGHGREDEAGMQNAISNRKKNEKEHDAYHTKYPKDTNHTSSSRDKKKKSPAEKSPVKKKVKFREDTRSSKYTGSGEDKRGSTTSNDAVSDYNSEQRAIERAKRDIDLKEESTSIKDKAKTDDNLRTTADRKLKAKTTKVNVKIKGRKSKDTIVPGKGNEAGGVDDVKKVKMTRGSGKNKVSTKVKYDKEGNVKKETVRYGRLGLRKKKGKSRGTEATVGTKEGKDLKGAAAAEAIVSKSGSNIRGKKKKTGDESALTKKGYKSKKC